MGVYTVLVYVMLAVDFEKKIISVVPREETILSPHPIVTCWAKERKVVVESPVKSEWLYSCDTEFLYYQMTGVDRVELTIGGRFEV